MVLEREEFARARGATVHGRLAGIGTSADGHHITAPDPGQRCVARDRGRAAHRRARPGRRRARQLPRHVHPGGRRRGGGGDPGRSATTRCSPRPSRRWVTCSVPPGRWRASRRSCRCATGSCRPTLNLERIDEGVQLDVVAGEARKVELTAAVNDAFGFGGHNVALVLRRRRSPAAAPPGPATRRGCRLTPQRADAHRASVSDRRRARPLAARASADLVQPGDRGAVARETRKGLQGRVPGRAEQLLKAAGHLAAGVSRSRVRSWSSPTTMSPLALVRPRQSPRDGAWQNPLHRPRQGSAPR